MRERNDLDSAFEDLLGEVAFGGVGDHGDYALAGAQATGDGDRGVDVGAGTGSAEDAFAGGQLLDRVEGLNVGNFEDLVADRAVEISRDEAVADALDFVGAGRASAED